MEILNKETKTPYEWCIELMLRPLDLNQWPLEWYGLKETHFFEFPTMDKAGMLEALKQCTVKPNSLPRKTEKYLEYRMFGLVPYNLSPIQQGIQYGHAVVEYSRYMNRVNDDVLEKIKYSKWADKDKTFIILNGGTTNLNPNRLGTLNQSLQMLNLNGVLTASFYEPDLGDQLTAVVFLVDERVFDYKGAYPDYVNTPYPSGYRKPTSKELEKWELENKVNFALWVEKIGGEKNLFLRNFLRNLKLA